MLSEIALIAGITLLPGLELRASIPAGIFTTNLHWSTVFLAAVISNILLGAVVYAVLEKLLIFFQDYRWFKKPYNWYHKRVHNKIHKNVEKYGELGLALFIGVPLPGSGVYSGSLAAHLLGMNFKKFFLANIIGVLMAGIVVTLICLFGDGAWNFFIKV